MFTSSITHHEASVIHDKSLAFMDELSLMQVTDEELRIAGVMGYDATGMLSTGSHQVTPVQAEKVWLVLILVLNASPWEET